mgnify:CR=1 FL=1
MSAFCNNIEMGQVSAKGIGDQIARAGRNITPVDVMAWGVIPGIGGALAMLVLLRYMNVSLSGEYEAQVCTEDDDGGAYKKCRPTMVSRKWNILWYIVGVPLAGFIVGSMVYQLGFAIENPGVAAGAAGASMVKHALFD